jgi:hypothetical protein
MTDELERIWKEAVVTLSKCYPRVCLEGLRKTTENIDQDIQCLGWNLNLSLLEYRLEAFPPEVTWSFLVAKNVDFEIYEIVILSCVGVKLGLSS